MQMNANIYPLYDKLSSVNNNRLTHVKGELLIISFTLMNTLIY